VRKAVREELRQGAHQIKIMGSGGVASPSDPVDRMQFSDAEISAAVEEAERHGAYVMAHCHPANAIKRCAELGVRSIEHATLIDEEAAPMAASELQEPASARSMPVRAVSLESAHMGMFEVKGSGWRCVGGVDGVQGLSPLR
jgi:imidazolonepropionase-like amidohydrolase